MAATTLDRFGRVDVLVNNAGWFKQAFRGPWTEIPVEEWDRAFEVNVRGTWLACASVVPAMRAQRSGKIINIGSDTVWKGTTGFLHYVSSKAAVLGLTRALAREVGDDGICVNMLCPDYIPDDEFYVLRTHLAPMSLAPAIRRVIREVDPKLLIAQIGTLEALVDGSMARARLTMVLLLVAAATALGLAMTGIYGVLSYAVSQRTAELGLRIALGAGPAAVVRMVVGQGALLTLVGVVVGAVGAVVLTRYLRAVLYEVSPTDPVAFAAMAGLLFGVALAASYVPARRAARVDPMVALRHE